jgi:hypothetical protein
MPKETAESTSDEFDLLSAIWVLASNDDSPIITYEGITHRFGIPAAVNVRALVASRPELFRLGVPAARIEKWKAVLREGRRLPSWLRDIEDLGKRNARIDGLSGDDAFRSQFRTTRDAPRSPIAIIEWGLQHLERLREGQLRKQEERTKKWSEIGIPLVSILAVVLTTASSIGIQYCYAPRVDASLKREERAFAARQDGYAQLMASLIAGREAALRGDKANLVTAINRTHVAFYALQPFVTATSADTTWHTIEAYRAILNALAEGVAKGRTTAWATDSLDRLQTRIRSNLGSCLFGSRLSTSYLEEGLASLSRRPPLRLGQAFSAGINPSSTCSQLASPPKAR